jgi:hypothetical protein
MRLTLLSILFFLLSCNQSEEIRILNNDKIVKPGEVLKILMYAPINNNYVPDFYLFSGRDTFALPYDFQKKCAVYNATHNIEKKHRYKGYVIYKNSEGEKTKSTFEIKYQIKK